MKTYQFLVISFVPDSFCYHVQFHLGNVLWRPMLVDLWSVKFSSLLGRCRSKFRIILALRRLQVVKIVGLNFILTIRELNCFLLQALLLYISLLEILSTNE